MSDSPQPGALKLAHRALAAIDRGELATAAALAGAAADAFLAEQGEPSFDAPNMLRVRAEALLTLGEHAEASRTLDRADGLAAPLPSGEPFDLLLVELGRLRGLALLDAGDRTGARDALTHALERCEATLGAGDPAAAALHNMLGIVGKFLGTFDDAAEHYARAIEIHARAGSGSPAVLATLHHNLGGLAHSRGDLEVAIAKTAWAPRCVAWAAWARRRRPTGRAWPRASAPRASRIRCSRRRC